MARASDREVLTFHEIEKTKKLGIWIEALHPPKDEIVQRQTRGNGLIVETDVPIALRDGTTVRANIHRPAGRDNEALPVILSYSVYGKDGALDMSIFPSSAGLDNARLSPDFVFEAADPQWWCARGYVCATVDARGSHKSEGDKHYYSRVVGLDGYDVVEWLGCQAWSNGRVGMYGASAFAMVQWLVAAEKPPHLAAIIPYDGMTDLYREMAHKGGIPETNFMKLYPLLFNWGPGLVEDSYAPLEEHPFFDEYWQSKIPNLANISCPAYVVCGWGDHGIHTRGTLHGYRSISSKEKYLEIHPFQKWEYAVTDESLSRQLAFFDKHLAGKDTEVQFWPKIRFSMRERYYVHEWRYSTEYPIPGTEYTKLFPTASGALSTVPVRHPHSVSYDAKNGDVFFELPVLESMEFAGYTKLRLWVEARGSDDLDLFVTLRKVDSSGKTVTFPFMTVADDGPIAFGWLRASRRELDQAASTDYRPVHAHQRELKVKGGDIVPVEIEILPTSCRFRSGDRLQLYISGHDYNRDVYPPGSMVPRHNNTVNTGTHVVHFGGKYDSHLLLPVLPVASSSLQANRPSVKMFINAQRIEDWRDEKFVHEYRTVHGQITAQVSTMVPALRSYRQVLALPRPKLSTLWGRDASVWDCTSVLTWSSMQELDRLMKDPNYRAGAAKHVFCDESKVEGSLARQVGDIMVDPIIYEKTKDAFSLYVFLGRASPQAETTGAELQERLSQVRRLSEGTTLLRYVLNQDITPANAPSTTFEGTPFEQGRWDLYGAVEQFWFRNLEDALSFFSQDRSGALGQLPSSLSAISSVAIGGYEAVPVLKSLDV